MLIWRTRGRRARALPAIQVCRSTFFATTGTLWTTGGALTLMASSCETSTTTRIPSRIIIEGELVIEGN